MDSVLTILPISAAAALIALCAHASGRARVRPWWLLVALLCVTADWLVLMTGKHLQTTWPLLADLGLRYNWVGKILCTLIMVAAVAGTGLSRREVGLTLRQAPGSVRPALAMTALLCALSWFAQAAMGNGPDLSLERLLYQATLPGIEEELFFRGVLFAVMMRAFAQDAGEPSTRVGIAGWIVTFVFGAGHGFAVSGGAIQFEAVAIVATGLIGLALMWMRQRTGSLLLPLLAHNAINFGSSFF